MWFFGNVPDESLAHAKQAADRAVELNPGLAEGYASQGLVKWIVEEDYNKAEQLFKRALSLGPRNAAVHRWYGRLLHLQGREGEALLEMLKAHEIDPLSSAINLELGGIYKRMRRIDDAIRQTEEVLELNPRNLDARLELALCKMYKWDWHSAENDLVKAIEMNPTYPPAHLHYAELLLCLGRKAEGEASLKRALALSSEPYTNDLLQDAGFLCYILGDFDRCLYFFRKAAAISPRLTFTHLLTALCHCMLGAYEDALEAVRNAEHTTDGFHPEPIAYKSMWIEFTRGVIYARMGNSDKAKQVLDRLRAFPSGLRDRALAIAGLLFHMGKLDEGFEWLQRSVEGRESGLRRIRIFHYPDEVARDPRYAAIVKPTGLLDQAD
jgi:tetratricopeptide (TPR) repeat protein